MLKPKPLKQEKKIMKNNNTLLTVNVNVIRPHGEAMCGSAEGKSTLTIKVF